MFVVVAPRSWRSNVDPSLSPWKIQLSSFKHHDGNSVFDNGFFSRCFMEVLLVDLLQDTVGIVVFVAGALSLHYALLYLTCAKLQNSSAYGVELPQDHND